MSVYSQHTETTPTKTVSSLVSSLQSSLPSPVSSTLLLPDSAPSEGSSGIPNGTSSMAKDAPAPSTSVLSVLPISPISPVSYHTPPMTGSRLPLLQPSSLQPPSSLASLSFVSVAAGSQLLARAMDIGRRLTAAPTHLHPLSIQNQSVPRATNTHEPLKSFMLSSPSAEKSLQANLTASLHSIYDDSDVDSDIDATTLLSADARSQVSGIISSASSSGRASFSTPWHQQGHAQTDCTGESVVIDLAASVAVRTMSVIGSVLHGMSDISEQIVVAVEPTIAYLVHVHTTRTISTESRSNTSQPSSTHSSNVPLPHEQHHSSLAPDTLARRMIDYRNGLLKTLFNMAERYPLLSPVVHSVLYKTPTQTLFTGASREALQSFHVSSRRPSSTSRVGNSPAESQLSFSFSGCSSLVFYEFGAASCLQDYIKDHLLEKCQFLGASHGAIVAATLALGLKVKMVSDIMKETYIESSNRLFGPISIMSEQLNLVLQRVLPGNISKAQGRLLVSLTEFPRMNNRISGKFDSREDLIDHLMASSYIPILYETPVKVHGVVCMDGGMYIPTPVLDKRTITVSPIIGAANISPSQTCFGDMKHTLGLQNASSIDEMFQIGYEDTRMWLRDQLHQGILTRLLFSRDP
ncbi:hypothetical protein BASA50_010552 [Batrachochytrium salamandrivorans]|uniref:PNPLA domain-containing protein n=1 Tax=Batrachochytrium salamandrivorans TaxID=1357716 RepID=A0ABQ8F123_9FUNG|nr:hypothetical protein BASA50_010552 [Batrachochytrium salamandrivorans]KAH9247459.1 hypothetical protein BASA81_014942 [Batrachochytrium salamandrivorans]KAH9265807.1 hypothetical protein BASA83_010939 [Batrachochytrium salamandrivorans]KAJ1344880.1 hypothetical protein BSLG_000395 [Batrachochytrium salamandrivorans]